MWLGADLVEKGSMGSGVVFSVPIRGFHPRLLILIPCGEQRPLWVTAKRERFDKFVCREEAGTNLKKGDVQ